MTLQFIPVREKDMWEDFILSHAPHALFQSWRWGEVQKKSGEEVDRFGLYDGKELVGIAQIIVVAAKRGTFLHVRHGPVWKDQKYWSEFSRLMRDMAQKEGAWFIRISPLIPPTSENKQILNNHGFYPAPIHEVDAERCWILDLTESEEELLLGMRKTTRYEIRLAQKSGVSVRLSADPKELKHFFQLYEATSQRHGFVGHTAIKEEFEVFIQDGNAVLLLGQYNGTVTAAAIVLFYGGQAIYHHGASKPSKLPVSHLVQWEAIREAKKRGMKLYNFWGIAPEDKPNHPWRGITLFKKGFGGREVTYIHAHDLPVSPLYVIPKTVETIRRIMKGY